MRLHAEIAAALSLFLPGPGRGSVVVSGFAGSVVSGFAASASASSDDDATDDELASFF